MSILKSYKYRALLVLILTAGPWLAAKTLDCGIKQPLRYAKNFSIEDFQTHRILTVCSNGNNSTHQYALIPRGAPLPELPVDIPVIRTPVENVVVFETVFIGFLDALNQLTAISGAGTTDYISNPTVRQRIEQGIIQKIQSGQVLNSERLLLLKPDLILISAPNEPTQTIPAQLARAGLPVVITAGYQEHHPLARAEWIKFVAAFFDETEAAEATFATVANRYEALLERIDPTDQSPTVFCGAPYSGIWYIAGGDSYMAQLIHDAGGDYLWSDVSGTNVIPLDIERVFSKAADADIWLDPSFYDSFSALYGADLRFRKFRAAQTRQVFNNTKQKTKTTGNPIWENGIVHPDDILADLIKIFHPDKLPNHEFVYYEQLR